LRGTSLILVLGALWGAAGLATAAALPVPGEEEPARALAPRCDVVTVLLLEEGACASGCRGVTIVVGGSGNCHGQRGPWNNGTGCDGPTIIVASDSNCHGADGRRPGEDGADGCTGPAIIIGDGNCRGGDGADAVQGLLRSSTFAAPPTENDITAHGNPEHGS